MQDYNNAYSYINSLTSGQADHAIIDWRCIHDTNKAVAAIPFRGTLSECWQSICNYNNQGYGAFSVINALDGKGRELSNVAYIRTHAIDLDNLSAMQNYERAAQWLPAPSFAVQSSVGKYHVYWPVQPYTGNEYYSIIQRKLRQLFDGDGSIIDATRVMRLPGTLHLKQSPQLVTIWGLPGFNQNRTVQELADALKTINIVDIGHKRHDLGDLTLAAPSIEWIDYALYHSDPNKMDRGEWISFTSAIKQSAWSLTDPETLFAKWSNWCAQYDKNDIGENIKQWNSIRQTEIGWPSIKRRVPTITAYETLGKPTVIANNTANIPLSASNMLLPTSNPPLSDCSGELLSENEQKIWFNGCVFINKFGLILTPEGRMLNATQFNGAYGGKSFIVSSVGKAVNEPWQAATRSTLWTIPKVDHIRFVPRRAPGEIIIDALGRKGVNTYKPAIIRSIPGDITQFLNHMELMLPVESDRFTLLSYMAHNVKYPGHKIPWAPLLQSGEGVGKGVIKRIMNYAIGGPYVHSPNAQELIQSGSKFNAWMRSKLFILVDEIKVDERRDMIEILKPMISEAEIEVQGKGIDQSTEDNNSNWAFFSNYKDAIPISKNSRRFAVFYSAIQTKADLTMRGMNKEYFNRLYDWLDNREGMAHVTDWLLNFPIACGAIAMRAPDTSSTAEAERQSRGPIEQAIMDAVEDGLPGFRGGWISALAVMTRVKAGGTRQPTQKTVATILEGLGYTSQGRAPRAYFQEAATERASLYHVNASADVSTFGRWQGYE